MRGTVVFPNAKSPYAIVQVDDGRLCAVKVLHDGHLELMDSVEMSCLEPGTEGRIHNLTSDIILEVVVQQTSCRLTWDETIAMIGLSPEPPEQA